MYLSFSLAPKQVLPHTKKEESRIKPERHLTGVELDDYTFYESASVMDKEYVRPVLSG